jgi:hypothetical protein
MPSPTELLDLAGRLPFPLALPLAEYARAQDPFIKVHRLTDAAEIVTRFVTMVFLSDVLQRQHEFPRTLREALVQHIERPTFGGWKDLLERVSRAAGKPQRCFVPELPQYVQDHLLPQLGPREGDVERHIIALRNHVAHAGRLSDSQARGHLDRHEARFEELMTALRFLEGYTLLGCTVERKLLRLQGFPGPGGQFAEMPAPPGPPDLQPGRVYLARDSSALDLFPLQAFSDVMQWREGDLERVADAVPQLYYRLSAKGYLEFTPLSDRASFAQLAGEALKQFLAHYRLEEWRQLTARERELREWSFADLRDELEEVFVGREDHVAEVKRQLRESDGGLLWVFGPPGVGKSALMARLARDYESAPDRYLTVPYFFRLGHPRCSTDAFLRAAMLHLVGPPARSDGPVPGLPERRAQFLQAVRQAPKRHGKKVLFLVDGLDEVHRLEPTFVSLMLEARAPGVVWVCAGRNEPPELGALLESGGAKRVFAAGLAPLDEPAVRALLTTPLGHLKYELFARDRQDQDAYRNRFVEVLTRKSQGLPLYVRMVIEDLREGKWSLQEEDRLPAGLTAYFDRILERLQVSDVGTILPFLFCLLARAREPLTEAVLNRVVRRDHPFRHRPDWQERFDAAVRAGSLMLRRAANPDDQEAWTFYHESFREHLLKTKRVESSRDWARDALLTCCCEWAAVDDNYPLRHYTTHLFEAGRRADIIALLLESDFLEVKGRRLADPYLAVPDVALLTRALLQEGRGDDVVRLAFTGDSYRRDGVAAGLRDAVDRDGALPQRVREIARRLLGPPPRSPVGRALRTVLFPWGWWAGRRATPEVLSGRQAAFEIALHAGLPDVLEEAAADRADVVRALLIPYLFRFWEKDRRQGRQLLENLVGKIWGKGLLPHTGSLIVAGGMSLHILIHHPGDPDVLVPLREAWKEPVRKAWSRINSTFGQALRPLAASLRWVMKTQPDYQPLNEVELMASYRRPRREHDLGLAVLEDLRDPARGVRETVRILMEEKPDFDVYLMMVAERVLVFHGCREPALVLAMLEELHRAGPPWFGQSAVYAAFHVLSRAREVPDAWLARHEQMTRATWGANGTFSTGNNVYRLSPHLAWLELVFERHRPRRQAPRTLFISEFYESARRAGDFEQGVRVLEACKILMVGYRTHDLALEALRPAIADWKPRAGSGDAEQRLADKTVEVLANIRFYEAEMVDKFLDQLDQGRLRRRVASTPPSLRSGDVVTWIDDFMNDRMLASDGFRAAIVEAFEQAGRATGMYDLLQKVFTWTMRLVGGDAPV